MALLEQQQQRHTRSIRGQPQQHNRSALRRLFVAHVLQCLSTTIREQAAPGLVFSMFRNDIAGTAKFLGNYDSASGLVAFLVSPSFGSLSDAFGRKPFLLLWPVASTVLSALVAWRPHKLLVFVQMALLGALVNAFETSVRSVIPDLTPTGDARAIANANIGACQGLAFFIGSGITGMLSQVDPRLSMAAASVTSVVAGLVLTSMPETLRHKRTPFVLRKANPFGFLDLWKSSSEYNLRTRGAIRRLALPFALQKTVWPGLNEQIHIYAAGQLNWQPADFARYMTLVGVGHLIGNKLTGPTLRLFGGQMHSHVANLLFALMFSLIGSAHMRMGWGTRQIHSAQVLGWIAVPHAVCETAISAQADAAQIGQGRLQGDIGNAIALIKVFVPMIYGRATAWGAQHNLPSAAIFVASGWWLVSTVLWTRVSQSDLEPNFKQRNLQTRN